ncbi:MAG: ABC transporter substrate-binding protein [Sphingobium sp.]
MPLPRRRPLLLAIAALVLLGVATAGWLLTRGGQPAGKGGAQVVLRVGSQKGGAKSAMLAAGVLKDLPYTIEWSEFPAAQHLLEALSSGAIDVGTAGDAPFLFAYQAGGPLVAVQAAKTADVSGSSAILVRKGSAIRGAADLKGKRIVTGRGSAGHYLLLKALQSAGLTASDVTIIFLAPSDANAALASGSADAWSVWPPYVGAALLHGDARIAVDARGLASGHLLQVANRKAVETKRAALADFLNRYADALAWTNAHPDKAASVLSGETGLPLDVARYSVERQKWAPVPIDAGLLEYEKTMLALFSEGGGFRITRPVDEAFDATLYTPKVP